MGHQDPVDSERWPVISLHDLRSRAARLNRPFGKAPWRPRDHDNTRIAGSVIMIRDAERGLALRDGRDWLGLGSRQYGYRLKAAGFLFADQTKLSKEHFERVERIVVRMRRCGLLGWEDVPDGRGIFHEPQGYRDNDERIETPTEVAAQIQNVINDYNDNRI